MTSCSIDKKIIENNTNISDKDAFKIIKSFKTNRSNVYSWRNCNEDKEMSKDNCIKFYPLKNKIIRRKKDTIGSKLNFFPNSFIRYKKKIFLYHSSNKILTEDIIKEFNRLELLNNIYYNFSDEEIFNKDINVPTITIFEKNESNLFFIEFKD